MDRVRARVKDKRVVALVQAFLKAGILTELGDHEDTHTGTPQGGILSPLLANIALSVLDEHLHGPWRPGGSMSTDYQRGAVAGTRACRTGGSSATRTISPCSCTAPKPTPHALREEIAHGVGHHGVVASRRRRPGWCTWPTGSTSWGSTSSGAARSGPNKWYVYTFIADRPIRSLKAKIRALTNRTSQQDPRAVLIRLNQIMRGWSNYFRHAVCKHTFRNLAHFAVVAGGRGG